MLPLASLLLFLVLLLLFPLVFANLMLASLSRLQLGPQMALVLLIGIFVGSLVNIPLKSIVREQDWSCIRSPSMALAMSGRACGASAAGPSSP